MIVGVPKEIKDNESRVGITPAGAKALTEAGHTVLVETQAGAQSGFPDAEYQNAGAEIVGDAGYAWGKADVVVKVATEARPRRRYTAGNAAKQVSLLRRFAPAEIFDKSLRKQFRLPV